MVKSAMRNAVIVSVIALLCSVAAAPAWSAPSNAAEAKALKQIRFVDEAIELGEYELAKVNLEKTLKDLKMAGSAVTPIAARTHVLLGVVYVLGFRNTKGATEEFTTAINIQKDVALPAAANNRAKIVFGRAYEALFPTVDCGKLMGIYHQPLPLAQEGATASLEAKLGKYLLDGSLTVLYRNVGTTKYSEAPMAKVEGCTFRGDIPGAGVNAPQVEYYLEARLKDGRPSARKGKAKVPFAINVSFGPVAAATPPKEAKTEAVVAEAKPEEVKTGFESSNTENDEIDVLLGKPRPTKGSGCAGCSTEGGAGGSWFWALLALLALKRRRNP